MWVKTTRGVLALRCRRSLSSQRNCSGPNQPSPAWVSFTTLTSPDEMHAMCVEAVPAARATTASEALEEKLPAIADGVMLAGHVIDLPPYALHDVGSDGKLFCRRQMTHISGMDHEVRLQCGHPVDRFRQWCPGRTDAHLALNPMCESLISAGKVKPRPSLRPALRHPRARGGAPRPRRSTPCRHLPTAGASRPGGAPRLSIRRLYSCCCSLQLTHAVLLT